MLHLCLFIGWFSLCSLTAGAPPLQRVANTTLQMPLNPPHTGYRTERAFGDLKFAKPVCLVVAPGDTNRLFVVEQAGRIAVITNLARPTWTLFLDISERVVYGGEQGLLGLAFHPQYRSNHYFYVFYTTSVTTGGGTGLHDRLSRFEIARGDSNRALPASELPLLTQYDQARNHNGGDLHFGPDGYLYVGLGDEGAGNDKFENSQRIDKNFFSGLLRLDVDRRPGSLPPNPHPAASTNYAVPPDNPFVGATRFNGLPVDPIRVRTEFWAVGLRNPWRFSYDAPSGRWYCGDVGQNKWESVHLLTSGGNYGWAFREGNHLGPHREPDGFKFSAPIWEYAHGSGMDQGNSLIGGVVYRGDRIPQLKGAYVFGDYVTGNLWSLRYEPGQTVVEDYLTDNKNVAAFGVDPRNGDVLLADHGADTIKRLVYEEKPTGTPFPPTLADTGAFKDLSLLTPQPGIVPYEPNVAFWSDHAIKQRWFSLPETTRTMGFDPTGNWKLPPGMVWIKHFEMELTNGVPASRRRLETRFLVRNRDGVYGVTYRWDRSQKNAMLVPEAGAEETLQIQDRGMRRTQVWRYPSRLECLTCHTPLGGYALSFNTAQLNRETGPAGDTVNQLRRLSQAGYFSNAIPEVQSLPRLVPASDTKASLADRVHAYVAVNCAYCHQPGGTAPTFWDARQATPLSLAGIINGPLNDHGSDPDSRIVVPGSPEHSQLLTRISRRGERQMPPLASSVVDETSVRLLTEWIRSLGNQ
ncbi:MAG: PQQ-dependent sugar dehydrogenase [Verrucomicrobiota bacterium]